ncbi:MAG TPA: SusD/RagB family nutrient-binding outer membrane lipoprotein [Parafilimonas sp.]|nr:SusD/RagB family nutrient-binding outer membrane lipoprotein [Parafilimonas sp.]
MKFKSIYIVAASSLMLSLAACEKQFTKENTNPTTVSADQFDPNFLLSTVQLNYNGSQEYQGENWTTEWGGIAGFIQHTASTNTSFYYGDKYLYSPGSFATYFVEGYPSQVQPVVELYQLTLNKPQYTNLHQMSRIMKALVFQRMTDIYGDVPYSQAGLGYYQRIYTPVYDKQQDIYADLLKEVSEAVDSLDESGDKPSGDLFYSADTTTQIDKWKRFGNSLLVRIAMRLSKVDPQTAQQYVSKLEGQTMMSNDDNAIVQHNAGNFQNRDAYEINGQDSADLKLCKTFIDTLKINNDPRLPDIAWIYATGDTKPQDQLGLPPGYIVGGLDSTHDITKSHGLGYNADSLGMQRYSRLTDKILNLTAPNLVLTYAETEFLLADAAEEFGTGDAQSHYNNAVLAAIAQFSVYGKGAAISDAKANAYLAAHELSTDKKTALDQINTQYWICTLMDEYEAWSNWRRSGYPILHPTDYTGNITNGTIPRRMEYPADQQFSNGANYKAAVARLPGGDELTSRVWWDTK